MTGGLKNFPKHKKNHSILYSRSAIELQSITVHYERLKTCPDRLHWCCVSSASTVLPPLVSFCRKKKIILLSFSFYSNPGPRTTRPSCHFLGLLWKRFLIVGAAEWNVRSSARRWFHGSAYPEMKTKGTTTSKKMSSTYHTERNTGGWGEAAPGCESLSAVEGVVFSHSLLHRRRIIINM